MQKEKKKRRLRFFLFPAELREMVQVRLIVSRCDGWWGSQSGGPVWLMRASVEAQQPAAREHTRTHTHTNTECWMSQERGNSVLSSLSSQFLSSPICLQSHLYDNASLFLYNCYSDPCKIIITSLWDSHPPHCCRGQMSVVGQEEKLQINKL